MTFDAFQEFVKINEDKLDGTAHEKPEDLKQYEGQLGNSLPASIKWLLSTYGYSNYSGIDNLGEAVSQTLSCRKSIALPDHWMILNDWGDGGVVLLNLETERIVYCDAASLDDVVCDKMDPSESWFEGYPNWVLNRLNDSKYN